MLKDRVDGASVIGGAYSSQASDWIDRSAPFSQDSADVADPN